MVAAVALFTNLSKKPATSIRKPSLQRAATSSQWPPKPWYSQSKDRPLTTEILVGSVTMWKGAQERELRIWEEAFPQLAEKSTEPAGWLWDRVCGNVSVWWCQSIPSLLNSWVDQPMLSSKTGPLTEKSSPSWAGWDNMGEERKSPGEKQLMTT